jgi:hypothetical protein
MYYVLEWKYVGPDPEQHINEHALLITSVPGRKNQSGEECTSGWLGTTNDWAEYAHGEFASLENARQAVAGVAGEDGYRAASQEDNPLSDLDDSIVEEYRVGALPYLTSSESKEYALAAAQDEVTSVTDDEDLDRIADEICRDIRENTGREPNCDAIRNLAEEIRGEKLETS